MDKLGRFELDSVYCGDCAKLLSELPDGCIQTVVTSPPYWGLRDYGVDGQFGLEKTPEEYVANLVEVFREVKRVLRDDGTLWLNLGDSYAGGKSRGRPPEPGHSRTDDGRVKTGNENKHRRPRAMSLKSKDLCGVPWLVAFALRTDGWYLRSDIIWAKPNPMPESVKDRPTRSHEYIFLLTKAVRYYYDADAIAEPLARPEELDRAVPARFGGANKWPGGNEYKRKTGGNFSREYAGAQPGHGAMDLERPNYETRNKRDVWTVSTSPYPEAHFATFPPKLIEPCILAGSKTGDIVLDPFAGSGTTLYVSKSLGRKFLGFDISEEYCELSRKRVNGIPYPMF